MKTLRDLQTVDEQAGALETGPVRKHGKVDANQPEIVAAFRQEGAGVLSLAAIGGGVADLLVSLQGLHLVEVKDGSKSPSERKLTPDQVEWHATWPVSVVESVGQVHQFCQRWRGHL